LEARQHTDLLNLANKRGVTICAGVSGTGKSTFALRYLVNAPVQVRFVFDAEGTRRGEYSERLQLAAARDAYELGLALCRGWVIFDPHALFAGQLDEGFAFFCEWVFAMSGRLPGAKVLVVDEAWKYVNPRRHPAELEACVRSGRKLGLECFFNTQTPHLLHATIRNECSELVCFRLGDPRCLEMPRDRGFNVEEIRALPDLQFIARNLDSGGELRGRIKV